MIQQVKLYQRVGGLFDIFFGEGWKDWTKVALKKDVKGEMVLDFVKGTPRTSQVMDTLKQLVITAKGKK